MNHTNQDFVTGHFLTLAVKENFIEIITSSYIYITRTRGQRVAQGVGYLPACANLGQTKV